MGALSQSGDYFRTRDYDLTVSVCVYCHRMVAAGQEVKTLEIAEKVHDCPDKRGAKGEE